MAGSSEKIVVVRDDMEGQLIRYENGKSISYAKRLPLNVAWHVDTFDDLSLFLEGYVQNICTNLEKGWLEIHYRQGIQPLDLDQLVAMVRPKEGAGDWRLAKLAIDLCACLEQCHASGIPQMVIHPERIAILDGQFVLLPTLGFIWPPFPDFVKKSSMRWLFCIAPEVIRTRCEDPVMLCKADIYALSRTLRLLVEPELANQEMDDPYAILIHRVEGTDTERSTWTDYLLDMQSTLTDMCAIDPENRPSLKKVREAMDSELGRFKEKRIGASPIPDTRFSEIERDLIDLQDTIKHEGFGFPQKQLYLWRAELALSHAPPKFVIAIDQLKKAQYEAPKDLELYRLIGAAYKAYEQHPQHFELSEEAYYEVARQTDWEQKTVEEWLSVLRYVSPDRFISHSPYLPADQTHAWIVERRAACYLELDRPLEAWYECVRYLKTFGHNTNVVATAEESAKKISPLTLMRWKSQDAEAERLDALLAIVWAMNGNLKRANYHLARSQQPPV